MTMISLAAAGVFLAVTKAQNPEMDIRPMLIMYGSVAVACVVMNLVSNRRRRDDE